MVMLARQAIGRIGQTKTGCRLVPGIFSRVLNAFAIYVIRVLLGSGLHTVPVPSAHLSRDVLGALRLELEVEVFYFILPDGLGVVHGFIFRLLEVSELVAVQIAPLFPDIRKDKGTFFFAVGANLLIAE
jgi:hypothetical protein